MSLGLVRSLLRVITLCFYLISSFCEIWLILAAGPERPDRRVKMALKSWGEAEHSAREQREDAI